MIYAVLSLGLALLGGIIYLAQTLRLSVPLLYGALVITVFRPWYLTHTALADGIFLVLVGLAALSWVVTLIRAVRETIWQSKGWQDCQPLLSDNLVKKSDRVR